MTTASAGRRVALVTLGCARNEVDSEELAGRLDADGWELVDDAQDADVVMVNTCGFVEQAKRDSIEVILAAEDTGLPVVAVGCLAERYGAELAGELPGATVLGFDDYPEISARLQDAYRGIPHQARTPQDRRTLLPIAPVERSGADAPGHTLTGVRLLDRGPSVPVKLASGCDRRCTFCAIPSFRGAFISRRPGDVLEETRALAAAGLKEVVLVSENSTSYGKDLGDMRLLETLLPELGAVPGLEWVRVSYLQPAEMRPGLVDAIAGTSGVARYFDLSFQHASASVLRRMRRFGGSEHFLELIGRIRAAAPEAGIRSNVIVGFPGETEADVAELRAFLAAAELDAVGVFGYSDEDGTEAVSLPDHLDDREIAARTDDVAGLAELLMAERAEMRVGQTSRVLVTSVVDGVAEGRAEHQGPEDGTTLLPREVGVESAAQDARIAGPTVGDVVDVEFVGSDGVDLVARLRT